MDRKIVLVTGAGSGIGRATSKLLAARGALVLALGRVEAELVGVYEEIGAAGGEARFAVADVADFAQMQNAVASLVGSAGRLDAVVVNAGINGVWAPIDDLRPEEWQTTLAVNLTGTYHTLHLTVPHLKAAGGGSIVIISSMNGTRVFTTPGATAYVATKAAQFAMAQQLAVELGRHRIRVNAICPGQITTSIGNSTVRRNREKAAVRVEWPEGNIPLTGKTPGEPQDIAEAIAFLISNAAKHITGTPLFVDGAQSLLL